MVIRADGRVVDELRPVRITRHFTDVPEGSVLIECGNTRVMCTATFTPSVPVSYTHLTLPTIYSV